MRGWGHGCWGYDKAEEELWKGKRGTSVLLDFAGTRIGEEQKNFSRLHVMPIMLKLDMHSGHWVSDGWQGL